MTKTEKNQQRRLREVETKFRNLLRDMGADPETVSLRKQVTTLEKRLRKLEQQ